MYDASKVVPIDGRNVIGQDGRLVWRNPQGGRWQRLGQSVDVTHWREVDEPRVLMIPIPDGYEPDGNWPRCLRCPNIGDTYINWHGHVITKESLNGDTCGIILRPIKPSFDEAEWWARHPWIKAPWIAMDPDERWFAYPHASEPSCDHARWWGADYQQLSGQAFDFDPPPCPDWRESKMKNPRAKATVE